MCLVRGVVQLLFEFMVFNLGLPRDPANLTHPSPLTEPDPPQTDPTSSAVGDGFVPQKPEFGRSEVGFPFPESYQTNSTEQQDF